MPAWEHAFPEPTWWNGPDTRGAGKSTGIAYRCVDCAWTGRGASACDHHTRTGHGLRGKHWPASWPNAQFSAPRRPLARWLVDHETRRETGR